LQTIELHANRSSAAYLQHSRLTRFYEKVIKVKADVVAIHLKFVLAPDCSHSRSKAARKLKPMGDAQGGEALLRGGAADFAAWGEPARPGFPLGKRERGSDSLLPQAFAVPRPFRIWLFLIRENKHIC
jgi:hypothetical protein